MKYLLKQNKEDKGILCNKVIIDGYKYYLYYNTEPKKIGQYYITKDNQVDIVKTGKELGKPILCSNNPNIDIVQVIDDVEDLDILKSKWYDNQEEDRSEAFVFQYSGIVDDALEKGIIIGYNKSQEMFPFTEEDMIEFAEWYSKEECVIERCSDGIFVHYENDLIPYKKLLQLWKEQQPKIIYYEN